MAEVSRPAAVLLIDDNTDDAFLFERAFKDCPAVAAVHTVTSVESAQCYLRGLGDYSDRAKYPMPRLIFVDLVLGGASGTDFVSWAKAHPRFKAIPIVAITGSISERQATDVLACGANAVMPKGADFDRLKQGLFVATDLWLRHCIGPELPAEPASASSRGSL